MNLLTMFRVLDGFVNIFLLFLFILLIWVGLNHLSKKKAENLNNVGVKETMEKKIEELEKVMGQWK